MHLKSHLRWTSFALAVFLAGCGDGYPERGQVEGTVMLRGELLSKGRITFVPDKGRPAMGTINSDGTYKLTTYADGDGALVGSHRVTIESVEVIGAPQYNTLEEEIAAREAGGTTPRLPQVKRIVPEKYSKAETTDLTTNVKAGANRIDFNLPK